MNCRDPNSFNLREARLEKAALQKELFLRNQEIKRLNSLLQEKNVDQPVQNEKVKCLNAAF